MNDVRLVYNQVKSNEGPIVFQMLVQAQNFSLCTLLGDTLTTDDDVFIEEWSLYFFAKEFYPSFEEVANAEQWLNAKARQWNHLSELDYVFCLDWFKQNPDEIA